MTIERLRRVSTAPRSPHDERTDDGCSFDLILHDHRTSNATIPCPESRKINIATSAVRERRDMDALRLEIL